MYKRGYLAADFRSNRSGQYCDENTTKICKVKHIIFAISGDLSCLEVIKLRIQNGADIGDIYTSVRDGSVIAYCIKTKKAYHITSNGYLELKQRQLKEGYSIGSGQDYAISAMLLGLSAEEAVRHSARLDMYTNKRVKVFKLI